MATTSRSAAARLVSLVVSALLLVGVSLLSVTPKAYAATPGTISGTVLDAVSGLPLAGVAVATVGSPTSTTTTDGSGAYTLSLDAGGYALTAALDGYVPKTSPQISVADGASVTGVNFTLQKYATVRGTVTNSSASGIGNVVIKLYDATTASANASYQFITTGSGMFEITHVAPGSYKVMYDASGASYMTRWYNLASTRDLATVVTIAPDATLDLSTSLVTASSVGGRVVGGGSGIADADVYLLQNGSLVAQTKTAADGSYLIGSIGGADQYTVQVDAAGYVSTWYGNVPSWVGARQFSLPDSSTITLDDVVMIPGGSISGVMTPGDVAFSYVSASEPGVGAYSSSVRAGGAYTIVELPTGTYDVTFRAPGYYPLTIPGVHVTAGATTTGISASLVAAPPGSGYMCTVTGKVVNLAGLGLPGVSVASAATRFTSTAADGSYSLEVSSDDASLNYILDGYVAQSTGSFCNGTATVVRDDVHLSRAVTIKGTVSTNQGPLAGATVYVYAAPNGSVVASEPTADDGTYTITDLVEGQYTVAAFKDVVSGTPYPPVFYGGGSSLATASYFSAPEGSSATNVNFLLYTAGSISGTVSLSDSTSVSGAQVTVWSKDFTKTVVAASDGTFTVGGLPAGTYTLSGYLTKWASVSQQVVVAEGQAVSGARIELGNGVAVSGIISVSGTPVTPVPHATVYLRTSDGKTDSVVANANGEYVFRGVPQGTYTVGTALGSDAWWLGGAKTPEHAATFSVATVPVTNLDITIPVRHVVTVTVLLPGGADHATSGSVAAYDSFGDYGASPSLNAQGVATADLWPGTYTLTVTVPGYPRATVSVLVTDAATATTVTLAAGGDLSAVKDAGSTAAGVSLIALEVASGLSTTGVDHLTGMTPGAYVVGYYPVNALGATCGPLGWYGGSSYLDATRVSVLALENTSLTVHATCAPATSSYTITGAVTAPVGVTLAAGRVDLSLTDAMGTTNERTVIEDGGAFTFTGLPSGSYTILASDSDLVLVDATVAVQVTGQDATITVPMMLGGTVTGRVVDSFGHQVAATVGLQGPGFGLSQNTRSGLFDLTGLQAGDYVMEIVPVAPYTKVLLSPVHVALGGTTDIGTVTVQVGGRITGHLPALSDLYLNATIEAVDGSGRVLASTTAQAGHDYALWGVPAGTTYVRFSGPGLVTTWWRTGSNLATATPVQVLPNGAVSGIDPTFELVVVPTTTISGTVLGADGPMSGVGVTATGASGGGGSATTAADGTYVMTVPAGDTYSVSAGFCFGQMSEISCSGQFLEATTTTTVATSPVTGVDLVFGTAQAAFTLAPVPTIAGDAVVGSTLTATVGTWDPTPSTTIQWLANGTAIPQAIGTTLVLTPDLLGTHITVQVTGTRTGYALTSRTSLPTSAVMPIPVVVGQPIFSGTPVVGTPVTVDPGSWSPADVTLSYAWTRDGTPLSTGATYTPTAGDAGQILSVTVMGTKDGQSALVTITSEVVLKGTLVPGTVTISGNATIGSTLTAQSGTSWGPAPVEVTYQWLRNGTAISGATQATYVVTADDVSAALSVTATGTKPGYVDAQVTSASVTVGLLTMPPAAVTVGSAPRVGQPLSAAVTGWPSGTVMTITWVSNGTVVGTGTTYTPAPADVNAPLTVSATGRLVGYNDGTAYQPLGPVQAGTITGTVAVTGSGMVGTTVTAAATWTPDLVPATTYTWQRNDVPVGTGATYLVADQDHSTTLSVVATSAAGVLGYTVTPATATVAVTPGTISGSVAITGTVAVGQTLTATGSWTSSSAAAAYTWARDGIPVATGATYVPTVADAGHLIAVQARVTAAGYSAATFDSSSVSIPLVAGTVSLPTATVGQVVTPTLSGWPDTAPTLSWNIDGRTESGATFTPLASDSGKTLTLVVTAAKVGFGSASATATLVVQDATMAAGAVAVTPSPTVGVASSAGLSGWADGSTFAYSWQVDSLEVSTTSSYIPTYADVGKKLTLTVAATKPGYGSATGSASATIAQGTITGGTVMISGTPAVGSTLTASSTGWTPSTATVAFQWLRGGVAIPSATSTTYVPSLADAGATLSVRATATAPGYVTTSVTSASTAAVPGSPSTVTPGTVTITGAPYALSTLTANPGTWSPGGVRLSYQWLRDGVAIPGATRQTYWVPGVDVGHTLSVSVTGSRFGYGSATAVSASTAPIQQQRVVAGTVTITGTPMVTLRLTAQPGTWSPTTVRLSYQWLRDGVAIPGATDQRYTLALADTGHRLTVSVTGSRFGYEPATAVSAPTAPVQAAQMDAGTVTITGTAAAGSRLTAHAGTWTPVSVNLSYQWLRDGVAIAGANGTRYTVALADVGHALAVRVTGTSNGFAPVTATSAPTAVVPAAQVAAGTVAIQGRAVQGSYLFAQTRGWSPNVSLSYQWLRDGVAIPAARRWYYQATTQDVGHVLTVVVTGTEAGYLPVSVTSAPTATVR